MESGLVSIIMPVQNACQYIEPAIASILNQSYSKFEFIIIEDGSTDSTRDIILSAMKGDERIRYIQHDACLGLPRSLNDGLELTQGKWIARMDGDDLAEPDRLFRQVDFLERNTSYGLIGTQGWFMTESGELMETSNFPLDHENCVTKILSGDNSFFHSSWMMSRRCFESVGFYNPCLFSGEDKDYWLRASEQFKVGNVDYLGISYRVHSNAFTARTIRQRKFFKSFVLDLYCQRKHSGVDFVGGERAMRWGHKTIDNIEVGGIVSYLLASNNLIGTNALILFTKNLMMALVMGWRKSYTWRAVMRLSSTFYGYLLKSVVAKIQ